MILEKEDVSMKRALFVWGGWEGHTPRESVELFVPWLGEKGYEVEVSDTLETFGDVERLETFDLIVPAWTMGELTPDQEEHLCLAVAKGAGLTGWHGTVVDSFRGSSNYQWMTGGQFVAHPGDLLDEWDVKIIDGEHEITKGVADFTLRETERYYMHVDPALQVLATTTFEDGTVMPVVWTKPWGKGRVAVVSFGHTWKDFEVPEAREIMERCLLWASQ
jgi:type 1 glutamine amidotransferase